MMCLSGIRTLMLLSVIALSLLECSLVSAISRDDFYPLGSNTLPRDDDITVETTLNPPFHFFGAPYSDIYVSTTLFLVFATLTNFTVSLVMSRSVLMG